MVTNKSRFAAFAIVAACMIFASGCGLVENTVNGTIGRVPSNPPSDPELPEIERLNLTVTVVVDSDAKTTGALTIDIDSPSGDQSLREDSVSIPFEQDFTIPTDTAFPLRNTRVEASAGPGASYVECKIIVNGDTVAAHRSTGSSATASCERGLRLGPS